MKVVFGISSTLSIFNDYLISYLSWKRQQSHTIVPSDYQSWEEDIRS